MSIHSWPAQDEGRTTMTDIPAQRPRNWWQRNWKWVVPVGVTAPILVCGGFVTLLFTFVHGVMTGSGAYEQAMATARGDTAVVAALGTPIEDGLLVTGNIQVDNRSGWAELAIPISGPKGDATLFVTAEKDGGEWYFETLDVRVQGTDEWIDLLRP